VQDRRGDDAGEAPEGRTMSGRAFRPSPIASRSACAPGATPNSTGANTAMTIANASTRQSIAALTAGMADGR
jgi:hypothetical protein